MKNFNIALSSLIAITFMFMTIAFYTANAAELEIHYYEAMSTANSLAVLILTIVGIQTIGNTIGSGIYYLIEKAAKENK